MNKVKHTVGHDNQAETALTEAERKQIFQNRRDKTNKTPISNNSTTG